MQIVLKVNHNSNRPKIPYIVDTGYQKRSCYVRSFKFYYTDVADGYKMVGNAVPVRLANVVASAIKDSL